MIFSEFFGTERNKAENLDTKKKPNTVSGARLCKEVVRRKRINEPSISCRSDNLGIFIFYTSDSAYHQSGIKFFNCVTFFAS